MRSLSGNVSEVTIRSKIKLLARDQEIVNTGRGLWQRAGTGVSAYTPPPPARTRMLAVIRELDGAWSLNDVLAALERRGDPMAIGTGQRRLADLTEEGRVVRVAHGLYRLNEAVAA